MSRQSHNFESSPDLYSESSRLIDPAFNASEQDYSTTSHNEYPYYKPINLVDLTHEDYITEEISFFSKPYFWSELRCWLPVLASLIFSFSAGSMHCFGNLTLYVASYLRMYLGEQITYNDIQWIYSVQSITQGLASVLGNKLQYTIGPRLASIFSGLTLSISLILSHYASNYRHLFLSYGILFGLGNGLIYILPIDIAIKWQPERKGIVTALIFIARGISSFVLSPWQTWYVNPHNKPPTYVSPSTKEAFYIDEYILRRVPQLFLWMGIAFAALQIISAPLMKFPSDSDEHIIKKRRRALNMKPHLKSGNTPQLSILQICSHKQFWALWMICFFNWQSIWFINGYWKVLGQVEFGISDTTLSFIGSFAAFFNSFGRLFWGYLADCCEFKTTMAAFSFSFTVCLLCIPLSCLMATHSKIIAYCLNLQFLRLIGGGDFTIVAPGASDIFGDKNFATVFGLIFTARAIGTLFSSQLILKLYNAASSTFLCIVMASFTFFAGLITLGNFLGPISLLRGQTPNPKRR